MSKAILKVASHSHSFDMYDDYEHRGKVFKEEVYKL